MEIFKQILHKIKEYDTIIIHRHMRPDPDALGSQVGLKKLLQVNFPEKKIKAAGKTEPTLAWLAKMDDVSDDDYKHALVIVCDTAILLGLMTNGTTKEIFSSKSIIIQTMTFTETFLGWILALVVLVS